MIMIMIILVILCTLITIAIDNIIYTIAKYFTASLHLVNFCTLTLNDYINSFCGDAPPRPLLQSRAGSSETVLGGQTLHDYLQPI